MKKPKIGECDAQKFRLTGWLMRFAEWITIAATAAFLSILIGGMFLRLLNHPLQAGEELSSLCFVWACFGGTALAYRNGSHIRLRFLTDRLSVSGREILGWISELLTIGFLALVVVQSIELILQLGSARMAISGLPQWLIYLPAPLFCSIMLVCKVESILMRPEERRNLPTAN